MPVSAAALLFVTQPRWLSSDKGTSQAHLGDAVTEGIQRQGLEKSIADEHILSPLPLGLVRVDSGAERATTSPPALPLEPDRPSDPPVVVKEMSMAEVEIELGELSFEINEHVKTITPSLEWIDYDDLDPTLAGPSNMDNWQVFDRITGDNERSFALAHRADFPEYFAAMDRVKSLQNHPVLVEQREAMTAEISYQADSIALEFNLSEEELRAAMKEANR